MELGPDLATYLIACCADTLVLHLQQLHDGYLPHRSGVHDPAAHVAR